MDGSQQVPTFRPHPLLPGGHAQTVLGRYLPDFQPAPPAATEQLVDLDDGDRLSVLDSRPEGWTRRAPTALLVHGLCGDAGAEYVVRMARRLLGLGSRVVRVNLRNAGSGFGLARGIYHAGRSEDLRAVARWIHAEAPDSPLALVGFSLGGNLVLKLAAEAAEAPLPNLDCVLAASPPLDLAACSAYLQRPAGWVYDRNFASLLRRQVARLHERFPELGAVSFRGVKSLREFDAAYTAPRNGFRDVDDYYTRSSAGPMLPRIDVPGLIVHALDDPFIPSGPFRSIQWPGHLKLDLVPTGGHLGFVSRRPWAGDRRWLEARMAAWLATHWKHDRTEELMPVSTLARQIDSTRTVTTPIPRSFRS